ncbi:PaaI family thioesterase [Bradyrhizobium vignae]|nr:PaaI family thioesterase [Bradyrhizobium vignae]RXG90928.1 PaaI family thioesterase [Bradyrhizobium vignae]
MNDYATFAASRTQIVAEGEFKGWTFYDDGGFETNAGPFFYREEPDGNMRCAFRVGKKHVRDTGIVHGGCLVAFADFCAGVIPVPVKQGGDSVTVTLGCEFLDAASEGDLIVGTGEITRAGRSMVFVRGQLTTGERKLLTFSGTLKRLKPKSAQPAA